MDFLLSLFLGAVAGYLLVHLLKYIAVGFITLKVIKHMESEESEELTEPNYIPVEVIKMNDQFYVYNRATSEFLAQGSDPEQVSKRLAERFPGIAMIADNSELEKIGFVFSNSGVDSPPESV
jgi:hypothetical protein